MTTAHRGLLAGSVTGILLMTGLMLPQVRVGSFDWAMSAFTAAFVSAAISAAYAMAAWMRSTPPQSQCLRCGETFGASAEVDDVRFAGPDDAMHYRDICFPCRRRLLELNQGRVAVG